MIYGNDYFILTLNKQGLVFHSTANVQQNDMFIIAVYSYEDKYLQNALEYQTVTGQNQQVIIDLPDGHYRIAVTIKCSDQQCTDMQEYYGTYKFEYRVNNGLFSLITEKLKRFLCDCHNCDTRKFNRCDSCKEENDCKNDYTFLVMLFSWFFGLSNPEELDGIDQYFPLALGNYYRQISFNSLDAFRKAFVRGHYELAEDIDYILLTAIYIFLISKYSLLYPDGNFSSVDFAVTNQIGDYFNSYFEFSKIKECVLNKGVDLYSMLRVYRDNLDAGYYGKGDAGLCEGVDDTTSCDYLLSLITSGQINLKRSEVKEIELEFGDVNEKIVLLFPISWGKVVRIIDSTRGDITEEFTRKCVSGYIAYISNDVYRNIIVKLTIEFDI